MRTNLSCCMLAGLGLALASPAQAATVTGSITSTLTLIAACQVNGGTATSGLNFGALNFGTVDALFTSANAQVQRSGGGAMSILCSAGAIPVIKVRAGLHDGQSSGGTRALADGAGNLCPTTFIPTPVLRTCWRSTAPSRYQPAPARPRRSIFTAGRWARPVCHPGPTPTLFRLSCRSEPCAAG